jgi:Tfp pilus assembly protein PilN
MIQVNLLPDVKREFIRARQLKRTVVSVSFLVSAVALGIFALFFIIVNVVQGTILSSLDNTIEENTKKLKAMPDIAKILTVQNQLNELPTLHNDKPVASRIFTYIKQLAPQEATIESLTVSFDETSMSIDGRAKDLASVNKFIDTLKFTSYADAKSKNSGRAFSDVVLAQFGVEQQANGGDGKNASYSITFKYAPEIFSAEADVKLTVPDKVTTRSETEKPVSIFGADTREGTQ